MAKFCGKCGSKLDESTGLCPNCDMDKLKEQSDLQESTETSNHKQEAVPKMEKPLSKKEKKKKKKAGKKAAKKAKKKEKRAGWSTGKKVRRFLLKLILIVFILGVFVFGGTSVLVYLNIVDLPIVSNILDRTGIKQESVSFSNQKIADCYIPNMQNIVYENENKTSGYVNNMILLFVYSDISENQISEIAEELGGEIVGKISGLHQYQIEVTPMSKGELDILCSKAMEFEEVKYAIVDTVFTLETEEISIPNDPWKDVFQGVWGTDWNEENPSGYNWWLEATKVPSAWQYQDSFSTFNVGIVDNGFDTSHEDLDITVLNNTVNNAEHHGTHVAGIIGAINNNQIGITGILDQVNLYGVDCYATSTQEKNNVTISSLMAGIELCISNDCKVVNMSSGVSPTTSEETKANAETTARYAIIYLICMLDSRENMNDFIIVQSAGNGDKNNKGVDAEQYAGYFSSITEDLVNEVFEYLDENDVQLEHDISVQDILDSYMVVAAVDKKQKEGTWQLSNFSNYGDSVTVCAPGVDVFSTTVMGGLNGNYANDTGTSMAAPIVSGITAMVWSVNTDMSAGEVKNIIQETADITVASRKKADDGTYYMINASEAVELALNYKPEYSKNNQQNQFEQSAPINQQQETVRTTSDERDIVLVLDTSGSMSGTPMEETKKAATNFINTILEEDASIGVVKYEDSAEQLSDFSVDKDFLTEKVVDISDGGGTNIEAGLEEAKSMLDTSTAKKKIIVLMSDGEPNGGKEGEELIDYADEIKNDDILIYTLGFFENMGDNKSSAQYLMEHLASDGCHYEVANADDLVFFFEDMADQINGQKYIYIRIACPVDVSVTYNDETLCSAEDDFNVRTEFGTLTFEDNEDMTDTGEDDRIKVLRLKEGVDYDVQIVGTGRGMMDYTIGFMDENGDYSDLRRFEDVKISNQTIIDTVAAVSDESILNIDEDGDGRYDLKLRAEENGYGEEVKTTVWIYVSICGGIVLLIVCVLIGVRIRRRKRKGRGNS